MNVRWTSAAALILASCGGTTATTTAAEPEPVEQPPAEPDVRVRVADEAPVDEIDPAIASAMETAVRNAFGPGHAEQLRAEAVLHDLATDEAGQMHARVRVTLVRIGSERICTVLEGGATAAQGANTTELAVIESAMRSALRTFDQEITECLASDAPVAPTPEPAQP